ncbi:hypothetical protein SD10_09185 [Spirosoma radiotolerans]|uniref:Uncharacterized protein n=2 Tax=Spirosoma radiotolerans TaxID=1379870 RepID=A0A0E3ZVE2_9BACT|nr:hypothetical protein SD10_09185 [Spirosoma radiotolerans]
MSYQMPINRKKRRYVIGIDPDKNDSGYAVYDRQLGRFVMHVAFDFTSLQEACFELDKEDSEFFVEAGWLNKGMHKRKKESLPKDFEKWSAAAREGYMFQRGVDVGTNFGAGFAIIHVLRANGYTVNLYHPKVDKWDAQMCQLYTGVSARINQDVRDAIRAAFLNL